MQLFKVFNDILENKKSRVDGYKSINDKSLTFIFYKLGCIHIQYARYQSNGTLLMHHKY